MYDKVSRAGITNVRLAQYKADVVRLVLELDSSREYEVTRSARRSASRVGADKFAAWHAGDRSTVASAGAVAKDDRAEPTATFAASPSAALREHLVQRSARSSRASPSPTRPRTSAT